MEKKVHILWLNQVLTKKLSTKLFSDNSQMCTFIVNLNNVQDLEQAAPLTDKDTADRDLMTIR